MNQPGMGDSISIVCVTFGDPELAVRTGTGLEAAQRSAGEQPVELVVVAVGPEGSGAAKLIADRCAPAKLEPIIVEVEAGTGYVGAANAGAARASGEVVVVARPEVSFHQRFIRRLAVEAAESWDLLAPAVREGEGSKVPAGATHRGRTLRLVPDDHPPKQAQPVAAGNGACVVIRRRVLDRRAQLAGGLFEEAFDHGAEDLDLFWWAESDGLLVRYVPNLIVGNAVGKETDIAPEISRRTMADYRVAVWRHASAPRDWWAWVLGESTALGEVVVAHRLAGLRRYASSWGDSLASVNRIRRRRGGLRK